MRHGVRLPPIDCAHVEDALVTLCQLLKETLPVKRPGDDCVEDHFVGAISARDHRTAEWVTFLQFIKEDIGQSGAYVDLVRFVAETDAKLRGPIDEVHQREVFQGLIER